MAQRYQALLIAEFGQTLEVPYPAEFSDLLQQSLFYFRRYFPTLFGISLVAGIIQVPAVLIAEEAGPVISTGEIVGLVVLSIPQYLALWLAQGAQIWVIGSAVVGRPVGFWDAWKAVLSRAFAYIATGLIAFLLAIPGLCLCGIGFLFTAAFFAVFIGQVVLLTGSSYFRAIAEHFHLVYQSRWLTVVGYLLVTGVLLYAVYAILYPAIFAPQILYYILREAIPVPLEWASLFFSALWTQVTNAIVQSYFTVFLTLLFFDLKSRLEGLDLHLIAQRFDQWGSSA
ncbi:MAG: hypothetical protein NZ959_02270 [Armatimonadetes bacterium]|nr:hypothetical protein [Armatimonadota bacterium]MDW8121000.1 hypothetical protein [Armatimonadota bacterium]